MTHFSPCHCDVVKWKKKLNKLKYWRPGRPSVSRHVPGKPRTWFERVALEREDGAGGSGERERSVYSSSHARPSRRVLHSEQSLSRLRGFFCLSRIRRSVDSSPRNSYRRVGRCKVDYGKLWKLISWWRSGPVNRSGSRGHVVAGGASQGIVLFCQ